MELSNAVTVLIARMETHPEDFEYGNKFGDFADAMWGLVGVDVKGLQAPLWFLSDADRQALRDAWAKVHYGRWEKEIMEKVFDENFYTRRDEQRIYEQQMKQQMYQQRMAAQSQMLPGQLHPLHNANTAQNSLLGNSLLGSGGNAAHSGGGFLSGIFK